MAWAACGIPSGEAARTRPGIASAIAFTSRGLPITPVEATRTSSERTPNCFAARSAVLRASFSPAVPVQALAHPAFAIIALALPFWICSWVRITGAAFTLFVVNTPAAVASFSEKISAKSRALPFLSPTATADALNPWTVILSWFMSLDPV